VTTYRDAEQGWVRMPHTTLNLGSSGPTRVETGQPDPEFKPRPVGFTADPGEAEPLVWDGDSA